MQVFVLGPKFILIVQNGLLKVYFPAGETGFLDALDLLVLVHLEQVVDHRLVLVVVHGRRDEVRASL